MESNQMNDSIHESVSVGVPQEKAFYAFAQQMTSWWPKRYTWSGTELNHIVLEPEAGARWYEVSESGKEEPDWGRLLVWEPPSRIVLSWMISPDRSTETDPSHASEVEAKFSADGEAQTRVEVIHRGFRNHGEGWESYREGMAGDEGWPAILQAFGEYLEHQEAQYEDIDERRLAG
jgi:uncharacterized protein YndB with AHSA1/START domain